MKYIEIYPLTVSHKKYVAGAELIDFQLQHWHGSDWDGSNLQYAGKKCSEKFDNLFSQTCHQRLVETCGNLSLKIIPGL